MLLKPYSMAELLGVAKAILTASQKLWRTDGADT
jgi:hypothetical protein